MAIFHNDTPHRAKRPGVIVGTPDPTKYHDASSVRIEGEGGYALGQLLPRPDVVKYGIRLPGVMVPRATMGGASLGNNHEKPMEIHLDPQYYGPNCVVDLDAMRNDTAGTQEAFMAAASQHSDSGDLAVAAFSRYLKNKNEPPTLHQPLPEAYAPPPQQQQAPPRSQVMTDSRVKAASFAPKKPDIKIMVDGTERDYAPGGPILPPAPVAQPQQALRAVHSLLDEMDGRKQPEAACHQYAPQNRPMRKVIFELPCPGQPNKSMGRMTVFFHDVVLTDDTMVLVYDHTQNSPMWFPEPIDDPTTHEQLPLACLLSQNGVSTLYKAFPTGIRFQYKNEEFCVVQIEAVKQLEGEA